MTQERREKTDRSYTFTDSRQVSRLISAKGDPNRIIAAEVGERYWEYRKLWDLARTFQITLPFPLQVDFEPLYACNIRCPICIMSLPAEERLRFGDPSVRLDRDTIVRLLDEGAVHGQAAVGLNGICEPLLWPDLPDMVEYARKIDMVDVMFNTNGLLLTEDLSRRLIRAGLTRIMISLDAFTPATYALARPGSDFSRVVENVKRFVRLRNEMGRTLPIVRVSFCVTSLNERELDDFIDYWSPIVDFFSIQHYGNTFEGRFADDRSRLFSDGHRYDPGRNPRCAQPWKRVMVRHNGDVMPCCDASGLHLSIGNIHQNSLREIWTGPAADRVRRMHQAGRYQDHPICRTCMTKWGAPGDGEGEPVQ